MMLLGFAGPAGAGKDTAADIAGGLLTAREQPWIKDAFAAPIKQALELMLPLSLPMGTFESREKKETVLEGIGVTPRAMAQTLGTEWGRDTINPDIWIYSFHQRVVAGRLGKALTILVSDVRFDNEAQYLRDHGGYVVEIQRDDRGAMDNAGHRSEGGIDPKLIDATIVNNGSKRELMVDVLLFLRNFGYIPDMGSLVKPETLPE